MGIVARRATRSLGSMWSVSIVRYSVFLSCAIVVGGVVAALIAPKGASRRRMWAVLSAFRAIAALVVVWYTAIVVFTFYPYCNPGWELPEAVCYVGNTDYGHAYHNIYWLTYGIGIFPALAILIAWGIVEVVSRAKG